MTNDRKRRAFTHSMHQEQALLETRKIWAMAASRALPTVLDVEDGVDPQDVAEDAAATADATAAEFVSRFCPEHLTSCLSQDFPGIRGGESDDDDDDDD